MRKYVKQKKNLFVAASLLIVVMLVSLLNPFGSTQAFAATANISYATAASVTGGGIYSKDSEANGTVTLTAPANNVITKATFQDMLGTKHEIQFPEGKQSWTGSIGKIKGKKVKVKADANSTAFYYAWDRYSGSRGEKWIAGEGDVACMEGPISAPTNGGKCTPSTTRPEYHTYGGVSMPDFPGVIDHERTATFKLDQPYFTDDSSQKRIPNNMVMSPVFSDIKIEPDYSKNVHFLPRPDYQPNNVFERMKLTPTNMHPIKIADSSSYTLQFSADFDRVDYPIVHSAPGARTMIYFFAFNSWVTSYTYEYPGTVTFEYAPVAVSPSPDPAPKSITGDFDILPGDTINYRDAFSLRPKNIIETGSCTYVSHVFRLANGSTYTAPRSTDKTQLLSFNYPNNYPAPISVGTVTVQMQIVGTGCSSDWISKTLTVNGPLNNQPPYFKLGWFREGDYSSTVPLTRVVQGTKVNVRYIDDPESIPVSPSDPENDPITITGWDYGRSTSWIGSLPGKYHFESRADRLSGIDTDTPGTHTIYATMADSFGASYTAGASLEVVPPNPIPIIDAPLVVKENRPIADSAFSSQRSYSPIGRMINHAKDEWTNKRSSYTNGTNEDIKTTVLLDVWDDGDPALKSLAAAQAMITIKPDLPPVAKLDVPPLGLRSLSVDLYNKSYSPDGDAIVSAEYKYKYDANNNGFTDDAWQTLSGSLDKVTYTPSKVGKYLFYVKAKEDYGREDDTVGDTESTLTLNVINLAPEVSFTISGKNEQPIIPVKKTFAASTILANWSLFQTNSSKALLNTSDWKSQTNGGLYAELGRGMEQQHRYSEYVGNQMTGETNEIFSAMEDAGNGPNGVSSYKGMVPGSRNLEKSEPILIPMNSSGKPVTEPNAPYTSLKAATFGKIMRTNKSYVYFDAEGYLWGLNKSKIPRYWNENLVSGTGYGMSINLMHYWKDPNPYDFAIPTTMPASYRTIPLYTQADTGVSGWQAKANAGDFSGASSVKVINSPELMGMEVAGDVIYMMYPYTFPVYAYNYQRRSTDNNGNVHYYDDTELVGSSTDPKLTVLTYDAYSGKLIAPALDKSVSLEYTNSNYWTYAQSLYSNQLNWVTQGDRFNLLKNEGQTMSYYEYDRTGKATASGSISFPTTTGNYVEKWKDYWGQIITEPERTFTCTWDNINTGSWKDEQGNLYFYKNKTCTTTIVTPRGYPYTGPLIETRTLSQYMNPEAPTGMYLIQYNVASHTYKVLTRMGGKSASYDSLGPYQYPTNNKPTMVINSFTRQAYARTFYVSYGNGDSYGTLQTFYETVNLDTGAIETGPVIANWANSWTSPFIIKPDGSRVNGLGTLNASGTTERNDWHTNELVVKSSNMAGVTQNAAARYTMGQYVGDGIWLSMYQSDYQGGGGGTSYGGLGGETYMYLDVGTTNPAEAYKGFQLGQWVSDEAIDNAEFSFNLTLNHPLEDKEWAGFSFRMTDAKNRYAVETDGSTLSLSRYINGTRTVLGSSPYPFQDNRSYSIKAKAQGTKLSVKLDGVPYLSADNSTFLTGTFGPFTDKSFVTFGNIGMLETPLPDIQWFSGYAIWEPATQTATAKYESILFTDPENDPKAAQSKWTYVHTPRFLNNQGISTLSGQTITGPQLTFDKVGDYLVTLQDRDDPHPSYLYPNMLFDSYRQDSNAFQAKLTVHRRPVAAFTLSAAANGIITWNDTSYDPDRWVSSTNYSTEATGIDYQATRGIMERKYAYRSPSGAQANEKLTRPTEKGEYELILQVRDEYGAWSDPVTQSLIVAVLPPPNAKPRVTLTNPTGAKATPTLVYTTQPTTTWNQWDDDGGVIKGYQVKVLDEIGRILSESGEVAISTTMTNWQWKTGELPRGLKLQVQVRVSDGEAWSDWSNIGWLKVNSAPIVSLTNPIGTEDVPQKIIDNLRPTITWNTSDPDAGQTTKTYQLIVANAAGVTKYDSGQVNGSWAFGRQSVAVGTNLPTNVPLQVKVRVYDGDLWSEWSGVEWLFINRKPTAVITYPNGSASNPTVVDRKPVITWDQTDPDADGEFVKFQLEVYNAAGVKVHDSGPVARPTRASEGYYELPNELPAGVIYHVRVEVYDGFDWGEFSDFTYMTVNRAPAAALSIPSPIYEGDTPSFTLHVTDPDGDDVDVRLNIDFNGNHHEMAAWMMLSSGSVKSFSYGPLTQPGTYTITLTVTDLFGESQTTRYSFPVLPLNISGKISHTVDWEKERQNWNSKHPNELRAPHVFWAGEALRLMAVVTKTDTATLPVEVTAKLLSTQDQVILAGNDFIHYSGILADPKLAHLADGEQTMRFQVRWSNGAVTVDDVSFIVQDSMYQVIVNQIRH
ncbi:MAG: hypothetical protein K6T85_00280 [Gorillibacterium sp.]|nr:hypothetical protein [Gorillibacterium sp.]